MTNILLLTLSIFAIFGNFSGTGKLKNDRVDLDVLTLSTEGQKAYKNLIQAAHFEGSHVGFTGALSGNIVDFGLLLGEKKSDKAFKSILRNGTPAGRLYGLSGIYFTDQVFFKKSVRRLATSDDTVMKMSGCVVYQEKVSNIVELESENVAIIKPGQTIEDVWKSNNQTYQLDISHGGYPATFRYYAETRNKK